MSDAAVRIATQSNGVSVIELVLQDHVLTPSVQRLAGPRVRLAIPTAMSLTSALEEVRPELFAAIEWALTSIYDQDEAPSRIYVRDAHGQELVTAIDPCQSYGLEAIIRP